MMSRHNQGTPYSPITSPKRRNSGHSLTWYDYHAAFSAGFAIDALRLCAPSKHVTVLDPWNGTGTTTWAAHRLEHEVVGFDLNPALVLIAKARHADNSSGPRIRSLANAICAHASAGVSVDSPAQYDALQRWFTPTSAAILRSIERSIFYLLIDTTGAPRLLFDSPTLSHVSDLAAFFYVALFHTVRSLVTPYRATNPTWFKDSPDPRKRLRTSSEKALTLFQQAIAELARRLDQLPLKKEIPHVVPPRIDISNSEKLPLPNDSVDLVLTSPPYCTRIDYVKATLPELSVLSPPSEENLHALRDKMLGTPTVRSAQPSLDRHWGGKSINFLSRVRSHPSVASSGYYHKYFIQYFDSLYRSLSEINRVLAPGGICAIVIQDSYYKNLRLDLPGVVSQMARTIGWSEEGKFSFPVETAYAMMNPASRRYRPAYSATETFLVFQS
jgi:DNA modification methylase